MDGDKISAKQIIIEAGYISQADPVRWENQLCD